MTRIHRIARFGSFSIFLLLLACEEDIKYGGILGTSGNGTESSGAHSITIDLGAPSSAPTTITYRVGGDAALDGDYRITSITAYNSDALTITIPAGQSTATIGFEIIDDKQIETSNEVIYFEITAISDATIASNFKQASYVFEIIDDDEPPDSGLQIDLAWDLGDGVRINASNFDLYVADSVAVNSDGELVFFRAIDGYTSAEASGFETVVLSEDLPNKQYYAIINYTSGNNTAELTLEFTTKTSHGSARGRVSSASVGRSLYYGPITKSGSAFTFR